MARPKRAPVEATFLHLDDAEQAARALRAKSLPVEMTEVTCLMCPGAVRKSGWVLYVSRDAVRKARRILEEAGFSRFLR